MTTTEHEQTIVQRILEAVAESEMVRSGRATPPSHPERQPNQETPWVKFVTKELANLPWHETNLPDGRTPPQPQAAVGLINLLGAALEQDTIAPSSVNTTWAGGVAVEWHLQDTDLEISCDPDGSTEFSFEDHTGQEHEEILTGDLTTLRQFVGKLPKSRQWTQ